MKRHTSQLVQHSPLTAALSLALLSLSQGSHAQPLATDATWLDRIVVVASRAPQPLDQVVANVVVIDREQMDRELVQDIRDLVRYTPGVDVLSEPNRFGRQGFAIRGLEGNRVRIEVDGVPLPDAFAVGQFAAAGRDLADLEVIEQVEILRGPASTIHGSDALAGVVSLRTRDPEDFLAIADADRYLGLRTGYNGRDNSWLGAATWAEALAPGWQALATFARREGHEDDNRARRPEDSANPADYRRDTFLGKLVYDADTAGRYTLTAEASQEDRETDVRSLRFAPGRFSTTFRLLGDDQNQRQRLSLTSQWTQPSTWLSDLSANLWMQEAQVRQDSEQWRLPDRASRNDTLRQRRFELEQRVFGADIVGQTRTRFVGLGHWLVYGLDIERSRYRGVRDGTQIDLVTGATTKTVLGEVLPVRDFPISWETHVGAFIQDEISVSEHMTLIPGLRWEHYRLSPRPDALFREDFPDLPVVRVTESEVTPHLGLRWTLAGGHSLFAQYVEGFRAPPFSDANIALSLTGVDVILLANPDLKPESSRGLELGWRYTGKQLRANVSVYRNRYRQLIETRANLGRDPDTGAFIFQSVNRDRARIRGIDAELEWHATDRWSLRGALSAARGDDTLRDQPLNSIQPARAVLGLGYNQTHWGAELVGTGVARKDRVDDSTAAVFRTPGYAQFDLLAWIELSPNARINAGIFNLANRRAWDWSSTRGVDPGAANLGFYTRPARSASIRLDLHW